MNRDELLVACFGRDDLPAGSKILETLEEPERRNVLAHLDLSYRPVMVWLRHEVGPGPGVQAATETLRVAAISNVCTDPAHRGKGYATRLLEDAHEEAATHATVEFAAVFAGEGVRGLYERLGYETPAEALLGGVPEFMVKALREREWPAGRIDTRGEW